jgi:hypothetical protein
LLTLTSIKIKNMKKLITLIFITISCVAVQAQTRNCGTMEHLDEIKLNDPQVEQRMQVEESVIQNWIANNPESLMLNVITIPVVVHIVYKTSAQNISDNDVYSQIQVLNDDFRKTNSDASSVPSAFSGVAADCEIEFCLAVRDPSGNVTTGITRTSTTTSSFSGYTSMKYSSSGGQNAWNTSDYLNIWVCNLASGLLGFATFPGGNPSTDGIVCDYAYFGDISATYPYDKGRTATHEVGHWLNLRHIWGDSNCGNDYVSDTPTQASSNGGCPSFPSTSNCTGNAPNGDMFMNYMDYTYDACMYMFSTGQKTRMRATLNGSRSSLQSSNGCVPVNVPIVVTATIIDVNCNGGNDGAIDVTISGGLAPFTYLWNTGSTTQDLSNLSQGNYTITVTDAQGQVQTASYIVTEPATISTSYNSVSTSAPGLNDGAIYTTTTGGVLPYSYIWVSPYATTQNLLNIGAGTYTFYAMDANSCFSTSIIIVQDGAIVYGCTDSTATNYDASANTDDGTCTYTSTCTIPSPTGAYVTELIHDRVRVNWDNMNDANCMVTQYRIRYRELGTSTWLSKTMANSGLCLFGLNTTSKKVVGLMPSTTYEYYMKAWYCGGSVSAWSAIQNFTTTDECENVINFAVSTPTNTKATFTWDSTAAYSFARIKLRVDTTGGVWTSAGGFGVFYPALTKDKNGLTPGTSYRAQARTWCDPTGGAYRSAAWTPLVFWTQPTTVKLAGESLIANLTIYPNPSRDVFNISFISDTKQDLRVRILNVVGEDLINDNLEQFIGEYTKQINLTNNAKGIYFLEIEMGDGVINKKLILQ